MIKLNRSYKLQVQRSDGKFQIFELPYTIDFDIHRNNYSSPNEATIKIYNLSPESRNLLRKDILDTDVSRRVILEVGYGDQMSTVFSGTLNQCWSARQGVNFITQIDARDNGYVYSNNTVSVSYSSGEQKKSVVNKIIKQLKDAGIEIAFIGDIQGTMPLGKQVTGSAVDLLREIVGDIVTIDTNKIQIISDKEAILGSLEVISSDSGLLNTPILENAFVRCELLLEPRVVINQKVKLESITASEGYNRVNGASSFEEMKRANSTYKFSVTSFNGDYKITGIRHSGTISQTTAGSATTSLVLSGEYIVNAYKGIGIGSIK